MRSDVVSTEPGADELVDRTTARWRWDADRPDRAQVLASAVAVGATLLAVVLGLIELSGPALTYDEAYTVQVVRGSFSDTWMRVTNWDTVQAPYYLLFSLWYDIGESEWLLRLPSVAFYVASVPVVFALGRRLVDARVGAVAAVLLALNALALTWGQQARSYAMALLLVAVATYLLVWALDRPASTARAVVYGLVAVVAIYAHFLVALVIAAHGVSLLVRRPPPWRFMAVAGGTIAALTVPAGIWVLTLRSDPLSWIRVPSTRNLAAMLADVTGGGLPQLVVIGPLGAVGLVAAVQLYRRQPGSWRAWAHLLPVLSVALPVAVLVVSTYTVKPLLHQRYLIIVVPAFALAAATGLVWLVDRHRRLGYVVGALVLAAAVQGAVDHYADNREHEWRTATAMVLADARPGDDVVVVPGNALLAVDYYLRRLDGPELGTLLPRAGDPPAGARLWEVERVREVTMDTRAWNPMPGYDQWRAEHYRLIDERRASQNLVVRLYERRPSA